METNNNGSMRNFVIIAHIDHGKSTLADRFLEFTGTVAMGKMNPQHLDAMDLEREKGITIKMQPVRMKYKDYILNLIDTPGHVDFSYEVSRALAAVEGAVLLIDASKGVQAQTLYNLDLAKKQGLIIIPVINKIDLPNAQTEKVTKDIMELLGVKEEDIIKISAKNGKNIEQVLETIIQKVPEPEIKNEMPLRALIFDSKYDSFKGVIAYARIEEGRLKKGEKIYLVVNGEKGDVKEVGFFKPELVECLELKSGDIGYIATGIKEPGKIRVGDTITKNQTDGSRLNEIKALPGYKEPSPMVFMSVYPQDANDFEDLKIALGKLKLNDPALTFTPETKEALGRGFLCGFLGSLHAEIITERLKREFGLILVISSPSVIFKLINNQNEEVEIKSATDWPDSSQIKETKEPWIKLEIMTPSNYLGKVLDLAQSFDMHYIDRRHFGEDKALLIYEAPLREMISGFYSEVLASTQGFASLNYELLDFRTSDLVKLEILIEGKVEEAFSKIVPSHKSYEEGSHLVKKLKENLPGQQFAVALQASVGGRVIARETMKSRGKDVIAPLYGGDYSRKRKLLERQKKGKKELKEKARIIIPAHVFFEVLKK